MFKKPTYPKTLTNADWQNSKGKLSKLAGKTGIGAKMDQVKKAFDAVDWGQFELNARLSSGAQTRTQVDRQYAKAMSQMEKVKEVDKESRALERMALELAKEWKKRRTIPSAARKHAESVHNAAKLFNYQICVGTVTGELEKEYRETAASIRKGPKAPEGKPPKDTPTIISAGAVAYERMPRSAEEFMRFCQNRSDRDGYMRFLRCQVASDTGLAVNRFNDLEICRQAYSVFGASQSKAEKYRAAGTAVWR